MIAVDTNILVYAHREDSLFHEQAYACLESLANGGAPWAIPWPCLHEFLAIVTHPRIYRPPTPLKAVVRPARGSTTPASSRRASNTGCASCGPPTASSVAFAA